MDLFFLGARWAWHTLGQGWRLGLCWVACAWVGPVLAQSVAAPRVPGLVQQALAQAKVPLSALSVVVSPLPAAGTAQVPSTHRLSYLADEPRNPASVMKLVTTYAGLSLLGPEHVWLNRVYTLGTVHDGVLQGHLVVRGSGDPKLVVERLQALLAQVKAMGVREIRGDIILDRSVFDVVARSVDFDEEPLRPYNVHPDGLLLNFKAVIYSFRPDPAAGVAHVSHVPPLAGFEVPARVPLAPGPCNDWHGLLRADFGQRQAARFAGTYPASCGERSWPVAFAHPEHYAPQLIAALWQEAGGVLTGQVRYGSKPAAARLLLEAPSLPLSSVIADINKFSNNVMAQQLFLTLSSELGSPGRFVASRLRVLRWWRENWPEQALPVLDNGSGLSRSERSTAQALTALLHTASTGTHAAPFWASLSVAGMDGTTVRMRERLPHSPVMGQAWLKTGSLRDVAAVAGYVKGQSGQHYSVVAIINHPNAAQARPALDHLLEWTHQDLSPLQTVQSRAPARRRPSQ